jgi:hypothetical protein
VSVSEGEKLQIILTARDRELARAIDRNTKRIAKFASTADRDLSRTAKRFDQMGTAAKSTHAPFSKVLNLSGSGRFVLQNTAAQLGDMSVQLESGTAASRVLAQQLPQLFGGFGALGGALGVVAPLLGTVAAVGIPLAAMFLTMGGETEEASDKVQTFAEKLSAAEAALGRAEAAMALASNGGVADLEKRYGDVTDKVRELAAALAEIEVRAAKVAIAGVLDQALGDNYQAQLDKVFGTVGAAVSISGTEQAAEDAAAIRQLIADVNAEIAIFEATNQAIPAGLTAQLQELRQELAAVEGRVADMGNLASEMVVDAETLRSLAELQARLEAARDAGDFYGVANAISEIRAILVDTGATIDQEVVDGLVQAEDQARTMAKELGQAEGAAEGTASAAEMIADGISPAVAEAIKLAEWLGVSLETARVLARLGPQGMPGAPQGGRGGDPREMGGGFDDWRYREADQFLEDWTPPRPSRGRSGGAGGGRGRKARKPKVPEEVRNYERALEKLDAAFVGVEGRAEGYRETLAGLKADYDAGRISADDFEKATKAVEDQFEATARAAKAMQDQAAQTFADIVTGASSAREALGNLLSSWASMFAKSAFGGLLSSPAVSGIFGDLGAILSFDGGGKTPGGPRSGGIDGRGGFMAMLHPNETVIDHTRGRAGAASGGGTASVNINVNVTGARGNSEVQEMVQRGVRQGLQEYDRKALPRRVQEINSDPRRIS